MMNRIKKDPGYAYQRTSQIQFKRIQKKAKIGKVETEQKNESNSNKETLLNGLNECEEVTETETENN